MSDNQARRDPISEVETSPGTVGEEALNPDSTFSVLWELETPNTDPILRLKSPAKMEIPSLLTLGTIPSITPTTGANLLPVGGILMWPTATAPTGFLLCDGSSQLIADYPGLSAVIRATFGGADASHFYLPNFKGVSPTGVGAQDINARTKTGPALGAAREDVFQSHIHSTVEPMGTAGTAGIQRSATASSTYSTTGIVKSPAEDAGFGPPRTGVYTHGPEIGVNFIVKT